MKISWIIPLIVLIVVALMLMGSMIYDSEVENNINRTTLNFSRSLENSIQWNQTWEDSFITNFTDYTNLNIDEINNIRIKKIVYSFIDFIGVTMFESAKMFVEFGYNHPEFDYRLLFNLAKTWLIVLIIIAIFPLIIPIIALITIVIMAINKLVIKIKERRENNNG